MKFRLTALPEVIIVEPDLYRDDRGFFQEVFHRSKYAANGIDCEFVQDNRSSSKAGVVRGLHFQNPTPQSKLVSVSHGAVFDVAVDIRAGSPTFGRWVAETLTGENGYQIWIPAGFAHGFLALEDSVVTYKVSDFHNPGGDAAIHWKCPRIGITWPEIGAPTLSEKDLGAPTLDEIDRDRLTFES